jgi:hypothetical protein
MKIKLIAVLALAALGLCTSANAQGTMAGMTTGVNGTTASGIAGSIPMPAGMVHDVTPFGQIDGKQNPDQITNDVAFRLLMNDLFTRDVNGKNGVIFEGLLNKIDLAPPDSDALRAVVIAYNKNLDALVSVNNNTVGGSLTFWRDVYALVYNTRLGLNLQLSDDGNEAFANYLQMHKQYLSVSPYDIGLGDSALNSTKELNMVASAGPMPQGMQMTSNYSKSVVYVVNFPASSVNNSPFYSGWAQDTGSGNGSFTTPNGQVIPVSGPVTDTNAYWPAGGFSSFGVSSMTLGVAPHYDASGNDNSIGVRTNISNNGNNFYIAEMSGNNYITLYSYRNNVYTWLSSWLLPSSLSSSFQTGDVLTLVTTNKNISVLYTPANAGQYSGAEIIVISYTDSNPLPAGYVGISECVCGGYGTFSGWTGGTGISATVSGTISGNTTGSGWPPSTMHTPRVVNTKGSLGATKTGNAVTPSTYVNLNNQQVYSWETNGTLTSPDLDNIIVGAYIFCTQVGTFFQSSGSPLLDTQSDNGSSSHYGEWVPCWAPEPGDTFPGCGGGLNFAWLAITFLHTTTFIPSTNTYQYILNCTTNTTPPDAIPPSYVTIHAYPYRIQNWRYYAVCFSDATATHFSCEGMSSSHIHSTFGTTWNPMFAPDLDAIELVKGVKTPQYCSHHAGAIQYPAP